MVKRTSTSINAVNSRRRTSRQLAATPRCPTRRPFEPHASDATRASHRQYVRAFSNSDDFALTGLVVTQQVGENPWHYCPSPQFVVTLEGSWYIRTSDGKTTTFKPGDVLYQDNSAEHPLAKLGASGQAPSGAQHWSGANGGPCNQLVLGVKPRVFPAAKPGTW